MCGIVGSYPHPDAQIVQRGLECLAHRGPDALVQKDIQNGSLGHARLAIIDVVGGTQPMQSGDHWIVFNGEIYNFRQLRQQLGGSGHTASDTEVILDLYLTQGCDCAAMLDGMFAFAILAPDHLFLARDPLGIKPLYWARVDEKVYFASEVKALLPFAGVVQEFPPGYSWHSRHGFRRFTPLVGLEQAQPNHRSPTEADFEKIRQTLAAAVEKRLIADPGVPVGVSLSGGLDSSIIVALARRERENLDTFGVGVPGSEDLEASEVMARFLGVRHHTLAYTFEDMLKALPEVIYHLESFDAALIRSAIPNYFLARLASDHVKVMLTGEGADELFAGYEYLRPLQDPQALQDELWQITSNLHNTNLQRTDRMTMAHGIEGRVPFLDFEMVQMAFRLPAAWKVLPRKGTEKKLLRIAFNEHLPGWLVRRPKKKFSQGAGSAEMMAEYANQTIADAEFAVARLQNSRVILRSKEELMYYWIFQEQFGSQIPPAVIGRTRSVTASELN